jgi:hypothetical protein
MLCDNNAISQYSLLAKSQNLWLRMHYSWYSFWWKCRIYVCVWVNKRSDSSYLESSCLLLFLVLCFHFSRGDLALWMLSGQHSITPCLLEHNMSATISNAET